MTKQYYKEQWTTMIVGIDKFVNQVEEDLMEVNVQNDQLEAFGDPTNNDRITPAEEPDYEKQEELANLLDELQDIQTIANNLNDTYIFKIYD